MSQEPCVFCRIAKREMPAEIVEESDGLIALKDLNPKAPVHLLIVPTEHIPTLADTSERHTLLLGHATQFANRLAKRFHLLPGGYRLIVNCGSDAGQTVWHLHWHVMGGRSLGWPPG